MKKISVITLFVLLFNFPMHSQEGESIQRINIKSPEVAAFERIGEIPVDVYTGVPNISIPIYTVRSGDIELPITLDYHATAIKVDQEATWVGLNWLLNAGGVISTQVTGSTGSNGLMEDWRHLFEDIAVYSYPINSELIQEYKINGSHELDWRGTLGYNLFPGVIPAPTDISPELYRKILYGNEGEAELFFANFMGNSFKFIYHRLQQKYIIIGRDKKFKIEGSTPIITKIIDENGVEYEFKETEVILPPSIHAGPTYPSRSVSYYLTKITSPSGRSISLVYKKYGTINPLRKVTQQIYADYPKKGSNASVENFLSDLYSINNSYLYEIRSDNEIIRFDVGSRVDIRGTGKKLESISIYHKESDSTEKLVKRVKFFYDYFPKNTVGGNTIYDYYNFMNQLASYNSFYSDDEIYKRLRLDSIQEEVINSNNQLEKLPPYNFGYYAGYYLPAKSSAACDYWGNYNETENSGGPYFHTLIPAPSKTGEEKVNAYPNPPSSVNYADKRFHPYAVRAGLLTGIRYPTGSTTYFTYEPHNFTNYTYFDVNTNTQPTFPTLSTMDSNINATIQDSILKSPKTFTLTQDMELEFTISFENPSAFSWGSMASAHAGLLVYKTAGNPNGPPIEYLVEYKDWKLGALNPDTANVTTLSYTEKFVLPPGKYQIKANTTLPQTTPYANFPGGRYVRMKVAKTNANISQGLGVRIQKIRQIDNNNEMITEYKYTAENGLSTGILMFPVNYSRQKLLVYQDDQLMSTMTELFVPRPPKLLHYWIQGSENMVPSFENKIGYSRVEVERVNTGSGNNGKTVYEFWNKKNTENRVWDYYKPLEDPRNGNLLKESVYSSSGKLLKETKNTYTMLNKESFFINAVAENIYSGYEGASGVGFNFYAEVCGGGRVQIYIYPSIKYWIELTNKVEKNYTDNGIVTESIVYTYNSFNLAVASIQKQLHSTNEQELTYFIYPQDYTASGQTYPAGLISKNILKSPMEIVSCRKNGSNTYVTAGLINKYNNNGKKIENLRLDILNPLLLSNFKFSNKSSYGTLGTETAGTSVYSPFSSYISKITCEYSDEGNPVYINEKENDKTVYLWGYSHQHPIAEIKNTTYEQVRSVLGDDLINRVAQAYTPSGSDLATINTTLRALSNVQVTTYTYKPLVGIETITDSRGVISYYVYDSFGRLKETYYYEENDPNKKRVIETYDYHYRN